MENNLVPGIVGAVAALFAAYCFYRASRTYPSEHPTSKETPSGESAWRRRQRWFMGTGLAFASLAIVCALLIAVVV